MELASAEDVVSGEVGQTFTSCTAVGETLGSHPNYWCWEMKEDDFHQVFQIAFLFLLMALGYYLLTYGATTCVLTSLKSVTYPPINQAQISEDNEELRWMFNRQSLPQWHWFQHGIATNLVLPIYLAMFILIQSIYFILKVFIVSTGSSHYIDNINDSFDRLDFEYFVNARGLDSVCLFSLYIFDLDLYKL